MSKSISSNGNSIVGCDDDGPGPNERVLKRSAQYCIDDWETWCVSCLLFTLSVSESNSSVKPIRSVDIAFRGNSKVTVGSYTELQNLTVCSLLLRVFLGVGLGALFINGLRLVSSNSTLFVELSAVFILRLFLICSSF